MFPNFIQLLKLVAIMVAWLPIPTPPFGESVLSSGPMLLQWKSLKSSASQVLVENTKFMETMAGMLRDQVTQENQFQSDVTEFLELIESHRPLNPLEVEIRDAVNIMAQSLQERDAAAKDIEQTLAGIKKRLSAKKEEGATDNSGATNISDVIGGTGPLALMIL